MASSDAASGSKAAAPGVAAVTFTERQEGGWTFLSDHAAQQENASAAKPLWVVAGPKSKGSLGAVQKSAPARPTVPQHQRRRSAGTFVVYGTMGHTLRERTAHKPWFIAALTACLALVLGTLIPRFLLSRQEDRGSVKRAGAAAGVPLLEPGGVGGGAYYPPTWRPWSPTQPSALALQWWSRGAGVTSRLDTGVSALQASTAGSLAGAGGAGTAIVIFAFLAAAGVAAGQTLNLMWARDIGAAAAAVTVLLAVFLAPSWGYAVVALTLGVAGVWVIRAGNASASPASFQVGYRSMLGFM